MRQEARGDGRYVNPRPMKGVRSTLMMMQLKAPLKDIVYLKSGACTHFHQWRLDTNHVELSRGETFD